MCFLLSPFTIELYDEVFALWQQCEGVGLSDADSRESIAAYLDRNPGLSVVATDDGRIVGAVLGGHDGRRGFLHHLAVHPDCRGKGLGRRLVEAALDRLKAEGIRKCHLLVFERHSDGQRFWEHLGWERREDIRVMSKTV